MVTAVIVRPRFDPATAFLYEWTNAFMSEYKADYPEDNIVDFSEGRATKDKVTTALDEIGDRSNTIYIHFDHGLYDKLIGQDRETVIDKSNADILNGMIVYAFACESARKLGKAVVENGALCYLGYKEIFGFVISKSKDFKKVAIEPAKMFVSGYTAQEVFEHTKGILTELLQKFYKEYKETGSYDSYMACVWCYKDLKGLTLHGDVNSRIDRNSEDSLDYYNTGVEL